MLLALSSLVWIVVPLKAGICLKLVPEAWVREIAGAYRRCVVDRAGTGGSIVLITDTIDPSARPDLARINGADVHILAVAGGPEVVPPVDSPPAPPLDMDSLQDSARVLAATVTVVTIDDTDVRRLASRIERSFVNAPPAEGERWRDEGWWLLLPLALLLLIFFRQGGAVVLR